MNFLTSEWANLWLVPHSAFVLLLPWSLPQAHLCQIMATLTICQIRHWFAERWSQGKSNSSETEGTVCVGVSGSGDTAGFIEGVGLGDIKWVKVDLDGTLGLGWEGNTVKGHYSSVVQALADTLYPPPFPLCLPAQVPCRGWSPETRLGLIYSPSLLSSAWLPLQWRNFLSPSLSLHSRETRE